MDMCFILSEGMNDTLLHFKHCESIIMAKYGSKSNNSALISSSLKNIDAHENSTARSKSPLSRGGLFNSDYKISKSFLSRGGVYLAGGFYWAT